MKPWTCGVASGGRGGPTSNTSRSRPSSRDKPTAATGPAPRQGWPEHSLVRPWTPGTGAAPSLRFTNGRLQAPARIPFACLSVCRRPGELGQDVSLDGYLLARPPGSLRRCLGWAQRRGQLPQAIIGCPLLIACRRTGTVNDPEEGRRRQAKFWKHVLMVMAAGLFGKTCVT